MSIKRQPSEWFIKDKSGKQGPLLEAEMREIVLSSSDPRLQVRQGDGEWHRAEDVRQKIDELANKGVYIRFDGVTEGPFTIAKAYESLRTVDPSGIRVRMGRRKKWVTARNWLKAVRKLDASRQSPIANGQSNLPLIEPATDLQDDEISLSEPDAVPQTPEEDAVVVATVVDTIPVAQVISEPVVYASAVEPTGPNPVFDQAVYQQPAVPVRPFANPVHRPRQNRSKQKSQPQYRPVEQDEDEGVGAVLMKVLGLVLSGVLLIGGVLLKGAGRAARRNVASNNQAAHRSQSYQSKSPVGRASRGNPAPIIKTLPGRSRGTSSPTSRPAQTVFVPARTPTVNPGMIFRPTLTTTSGSVNAGTAFTGQVDGYPHTLIVTALHLFGPTGGLPKEIPANEMDRRWTGLSLRDCKSGALQAGVPMTPLVLSGTKRLSERSANQGDVAICVLNNRNNRRYSPSKLASVSPAVGDTVWLLSEVIGSSQLVHRATVMGIEDGWLLYKYQIPIELRATSGAPVINDRNEIVAVNAGGGGKVAA